MVDKQVQTQAHVQDVPTRIPLPYLDGCPGLFLFASDLQDASALADS